jgi:hypothetical protein
MKSLNNHLTNIKLTFLLVLVSILITNEPLIAQNVFTPNTSNTFEKLVEGDIALADIDGDNDLDVLYSGNRGGRLQGLSKIRLHTNDGNGNYTQVNSIPFIPTDRAGIAFADVDGDNDQDLVIAGHGLDLSIPFVAVYAYLYLNDGSGNFTLQNGTPFVGSAYCSVAFADVDNDSDQDLCIVGTSHSAVYINDGSGSFTIGTTLTALNGSALSFGDVNGDNYTDLLISGHSGSYYTQLYLNNGSGGFTLVNGTPFTGIREGSVHINDMNGDNINDIFITGAISGSNNSFSGLYINDGSGNFTLNTNTTFDKGYTALIADIDGDNDNDIVMSAYYSTFIQEKSAIYYNDGAGNFHQMQNEWLDKMGCYRMAYGDVNGDNIKDLFVMGYDGNLGSSKGNVRWYKNTHTTKANKALDFDGTNTFTAQHFDALNTLPLSVGFWAKIPTTDTDIGLIKKTDGANNGFEIYTTSGTLHAKYSKDASNHVAVQSSTTVNDDIWHHIAFVVDNSNAKLYIDGVLVQTSAWTGTATNHLNQNNLILGQGTNNYNGLLDEVRIWNTARTASEIRQNMYTVFSKPTDQTNLIANYTMNMSVDSLIFDVSQHFNRAAISGGSVTLTDEFISYSAAAATNNTSVQNTTTTIGKITFDDATANGNDPFDAAVEIVVAQVNGAPNVTTGISEANINGKYYIVQLYNGAGTFSVDVSIACGCADGSTVALYRRDDHSTGAWTLLATGTTTGGIATFQNISSFSQLIVASATPLPVELLSFNATAEANHIRLDWSVGIEENLSHYEIEKSVDGLDFRNIGAVTAQGLSFYKFEDYDVFKNNVYYYRLKAVDFDGKFEYSNVLNIEYSPDSYRERNIEYRIFPNPANDFITVEINEPTTIQIINSTGQILLEKQMSNTAQLDISNLVSGIYWIKINDSISQPLVKK